MSGGAATGRKYRTRLEVLRDILATSHEETNKTRIIRLANLNPASFDRYVAFCIDNALLESTGGRYRNTESGEAAVGAIDRVLSKAEELGFAVHELGSVVGKEKPGQAHDVPALRFASAVAWSELLQSGARSGGFRVELVGAPAIDHSVSSAGGARTRSRLAGKGPWVSPEPAPLAQGAQHPTRRSLRHHEK